MNAGEMTTIKVPVAVRDKLRERAARQHVTQAEALERLLDEAPHEDVHRWIAEESARWKPLLDRLA